MPRDKLKQFSVQLPPALVLDARALLKRHESLSAMIREALYTEVGRRTQERGNKTCDT